MPSTDSRRSTPLMRVTSTFTSFVQIHIPSTVYISSPTPIPFRKTGGPSGGGHCPGTWANSSGLLLRVSSRQFLPQGSRGVLYGSLPSLSPAEGFSNRRRPEPRHWTRPGLHGVLRRDQHGGRAVSRWKAGFRFSPPWRQQRAIRTRRYDGNVRNFPRGLPNPVAVRRKRPFDLLSHPRCRPPEAPSCFTPIA